MIQQLSLGGADGVYGTKAKVLSSQSIVTEESVYGKKSTVMNGASTAAMGGPNGVYGTKGKLPDEAGIRTSEAGIRTSAHIRLFFA